MEKYFLIMVGLIFWLLPLLATTLFPQIMQSGKSFWYGYSFILFSLFFLSSGAYFFNKGVGG